MTLDPASHLIAAACQLVKDRHCVITGGSGSIGLAAARLLHAHGARIFLVDRDSAALAAAATRFPADQPIGWCAADVRNAGDTARYVGQAVAQFGQIDTLFANAGIAGVVSPVAHYPDDVFDDVLAVSVRGSFLAAKYAIPVMRDGGSIILMSSIMGLTADPRRRRLCHGQTCGRRPDARAGEGAGAAGHPGQQPASGAR